MLSDFVVYLAYADRLARGVSLLVKNSLGVKVVVDDIAMKSNTFRDVAVYEPNDQRERNSFFCQLLDDSARFDGGLECHPRPQQEAGS